jgi:hypothetical protein
MEKQRHECGCRECRKDSASPEAERHRLLNEAILHSQENNRRLVAGLEAMRVGRGGITKVSRITGLDRNTIARGIRELREGRPAMGRIRRAGGGRKKAGKKGPRTSSGAQETDAG